MPARKPAAGAIPDTSSATPPATRDRAASEERLLQAVGTVLAREGFAALGVNAVAREAGVDKVLIYRYFGGLPELLTAWGSSGRFWPTVEELMGDDAAALPGWPLAERWALFFDRFIDALRARPLTLEILAAEVVSRNALTAILEEERERWGERVEAAFCGEDFQRRPELRGVTLLLVAGIQYLLVRGRLIRQFGALQLDSDASWQQLKQALRTMGEGWLGAPAAPRGRRS